MAPPYQRPPMLIPEQYKEDSTWKPANTYIEISEQKCWWEIYNDPVLNDLQIKVGLLNQDLKAQLARYENAIAVYEIANSGLYPNLSINGDANRQQTSKTVANPSSHTRYNDRLITANFAYELDLWQRVRNNVRASKYRMQASSQDLRATELSLRTLLCSNYFALQAADESLHTLKELTSAYEKALALTSNRFKEGIATQGDVAQAQTQLENVKTLYADKKLQRATFEHSIAVLVGEAPANFSLAMGHQTSLVPIIGSDLPSTLLERRPDIFSAERQVMAANADIGVAKAAFFPSLNLIADGGYESARFAKLFDVPSLVWSLGPTVMQYLYDGGNLQGRLDAAKATYHETVANYRQTVLNAFKEVEDNLAAQFLLEEQSISQNRAVTSSSEALAQSYYRYEGGIATYLDIVVTQNIALQAKLAAIDLHARRQIASVNLIKALGGPW